LRERLDEIAFQEVLADMKAEIEYQKQVSKL